MGSKRSTKPGLTQVIYEGLRNEIVAGKLKPGESLSRRQVASRYGSSYIPVIEAMVRLEGLGLVQSESNQMARVREISIETIQSDYVLREAYETQAIRLASLAANDEEIDELYGLAASVDERSPSTSDGESSADQEGVLLHWEFHKRIAELSRQPVLVRELERIEMLGRLQANWCFLPEMPDPPRWHSILVDAIKARDPEGADVVMRVHVKRGFQKEVLAYQQMPSFPKEEECP